MINLATALTIAATLAGVNAEAPKPAPNPLPSGTVIVKISRTATAPEQNYEVDGDMQQTPALTPDQKYAELKAKLDERFAYMFRLKDEIDKQNQLANAKWEEYYALRDAYEKQLKKIIADWVTEQNFA